MLSSSAQGRTWARYLGPILPTRRSTVPLAHLCKSPFDLHLIRPLRPRTHDRAQRRREEKWAARATLPAFEDGTGGEISGQESAKR